MSRYREMAKNTAVIDLFCGIGGLSYGFFKEGFNIVAGYDIDETCKFAFETNNKSKFISKDIKEVKSSEVINLYKTVAPKFKVLVGCAPCQPFSSYTFKDKEKSNGKWGLLYEFIRLIEEVKPDVVSMENVPQLLNFKKAPVFEDFVNRLEELGYHVSYKIVNCLEYGIPQRRKRLVLLASRLGPISLIPKTHTSDKYVTVKDVISALPKIEDGETCASDPLHFARKLSDINKERIRSTPQGGSWKNWPEHLVLECHKKKTGKSYLSVYGRMKWNEPSPTITTHCIGYGNGRFGHPTQDRAISLREAALFQTFPKKYKFYNPKQGYSTVALARQLGNAVPVSLGQVIAKSIQKHLNNRSHE